MPSLFSNIIRAYRCRFLFFLLLVTGVQEGFCQDTIRYTGSTTFCQGGNLTLIANRAPANSVCQWTRNTIAITGATTPTYSATQSGTYSVTVTSPTGFGPYNDLDVTVNLLPVVAYSFSPNGQCGTIPIIFTNNSTGNNLTYIWNFGDPNSGANNISSDINPIHKFIGTPGNGSQNFNVTLTATSSDGCVATSTQAVTVKQLPGTQLDGPNQAIYNGLKYFRQCSGATSLDFSNASTTLGTNTLYKIVWGDNSPDFISSTFIGLQTHTYSVGTYPLLFIVTNGNGCVDTGYYYIFIGSNPAVGLGNPGNTTVCSGTSLTFPITLASSNNIGTTYTVTFNDQSPILTYTQPPPNDVTHVFNISSCGVTSLSYLNSFSAIIVASNPCLTTSSLVAPIYVSQKPQAAFSISPKDTVCVNTKINITNTSSSNKYINPPNCISGKSVWTIFPTTGWTLTSGLLGTDNGSSNPGSWSSLFNDTINLNFSVPGTYLIKFKTGNPNCGADSITKTICVNPAPIGGFNLDNTVGCAPLTVKTTNTSNAPICGNNTYIWTVSYVPTSGCTPSTMSYVYLGGTNAASSDPQFQFINPGVYTISLITKSSSGTCIATAVTKQITVKGKPTASINLPISICQAVAVNPTSISACYTTTATYAWTFAGANPASSTIANPTNITYPNAGTFPITLAVTNECGTTNATNQLIVYQIPDVIVPTNQIFCNGIKTSPLNFSSTVSGTTFKWSNNNTAIGLPASGTTGNIPSFTAINLGPIPINATITVTPINGNTCNGTPATFTITVYPIPATPIVTSPVNYCQNATVVGLIATPLTGNTLNWYTAATGGTASTVAPTPITTTVGTTNYYVSQTNAGGCEGQRTMITVNVSAIPNLGTATGTNPLSCAASTGFITLTGLTSNTLYTVSYTKNGTNVSLSLTSDGTGNIKIPSLSAGTYDNIVATRSNCPSNALGPVSLVDPTPPATPTAGSNSPQCSGGTLSLTASTFSNATYTWSGPNFSTTVQNPNITNVTIAASGTYSVTATVSGCTSAAGTVAVIINPTPVGLAAASNGPICSGDTLKLSSSSTTTGSITYAWTGPNNFSSLLQNPTIPNATTTISGMYTVLTTLGSCSATKTVTAAVNPTPLITDSSFVQPSNCISATGSISLIGLANGTSYSVSYLKNGTAVNTTITSNLTGTLMITSLGAGTYSNVIVTSANCPSRSIGPFVLIAPNPPATPTDSSNSPICSGSPVKLFASTATAGATFNWTGPNGFVSNLQNPTILSATVATSGTYSVTATINGCTSQPATTVVVVSSVAIVANAGPTQQLCNTFASVLAANAAGNGTGTWTIIAPSTAVITLLNNPISSINNLPIGITKAVWTINNNVCQPTSDTVQIVVSPALTNNISPLSNTICTGQSFTLTGVTPTGGSGSYSYQWQQSTNNVLFTNIVGATTINLNVSPTTTTYYRRNVTSSPCANYSDTALITVLGVISSNTINSNQIICTNTAPNLITGGLPIGGGGAFTYTWEQSTDNGLTWTLIIGATNQDYQPSILTILTSYRRTVVTALCGGPQASTSNVISIKINPNAKALFNPTTTNGCVPFKITPAIINLTPFPATNGLYNWYVNGISIGSGQTFPGYTMVNTGDSITVKLVTISLFGCKNDSMQVGFKTIVKPVPAFTQSDSVGCGPLRITFKNLTPNIANYSYQWDFGTGQTLSLAQPGLINFPINPNYGDTVYTVKFKTFSQCDTIVLTSFVRVQSKPKALFTPDKSVGCSPMAVTFSNTTKGTVNQPFIWDFGDGSAPLISTASSVQHTYNVGQRDTIKVRLVTTNDCGSDTLVYALVVQPNTIRLDFAINGNNRYGCAPQTVAFINNTSGANAFTWNFGDGSSLLNTTRGVDTIYHTYNTIGNFTATLKASNSCSDTSDVELVTIFAKPIVSISAFPLTACIGDTIRFINQSDTGVSNLWKFGDGTTSFDRAPIKSYFSSGNFGVNYTASYVYANGTVCADTGLLNIVIRDTLQGSFTISDTVGACAPFAITVKYNGIASLQTKWDFGDGTTALGDSETHTFLKPGTYIVRMYVKENTGGCISTASKQVVVGGVTGSFTYQSDYFCMSSPVSFKAISTNASQYRYFFGDGDSLTTNVTPVLHSYTKPGYYFPSVQLFNGTCILKITGPDTIKIDGAKLGFITKATATCDVTAIQFTDTSYSYFGIKTFVWDFGDGTTTSQLHNPLHTYTTSGTYNIGLKTTGISGCINMTSVQLAVLVHNYPVTSIVGDSLACTNQTVALVANVQSVDSIQAIDWAFGNNATGNGINVNARYASAGNYLVRLIARTIFGCADTSFKIIHANTSPNVVAGADVTVCKGQSLQIAAIGANNFTWFPTQGLSCTTCASPIASPTFTTNYTVVGSNSFGCTAADSITVNVVQPLAMIVSPDDTICIGDHVQLTATNAFYYAWNPTTGLNNSQVSNPIANPTYTTKYRVVGRDASNCFSDTGFVVIAVGQYPVVDFGTIGGLVIAGTAIQLNPTISNGPIRYYRWTPTKDLSCTACGNPIATINTNVTYILEAENSYGCKGSDTISYRVTCESSQIFIANAFTPDKDGVNDILFVQGKGISQVKYFRIFNRWGQLVFERSNFAANDPSSGWDGKVNGQLATSEVYVYTAEVICTAGSTFVYKGNVTLIR